MKKLINVCIAICLIVYITLLSYICTTVSAFVLITNALRFKTLAIIMHKFINKIANHINNIVDEIDSIS